MMLLSRHERHQQSFEHQKRAQSTASPDQTSIHVNDLAHVDVDVPVEKVWRHLQLSPTGFTQKTWMLEKIQINHPTYPTQKNNIDCIIFTYSKMERSIGALGTWSCCMTTTPVLGRRNACSTSWTTSTSSQKSTSWIVPKSST